MDLLVSDPLARLLTQVVAVVLLSRALAPLLRRLGQPMVIAEIGAGIVLGPTLLGWWMPETAGALFAPEAMRPLQLVSELGLVMFMFIIGLELDPKLLREHLGRAVAISQASILVPFGAGALLALYLHHRHPETGTSPGLLALFVGTAMSATAFPVLARILSERRLVRTRMGAITLACAAVDDVIFWCLVAFVVAAARAHGLRDAVIAVVLTGAYLAFMFAVVRPLLGRLAQRVSGVATLDQRTVAVVIVLLFASSWVTEWIGIQALFGAFVLGVVLPKGGGLARGLASRLEDVVLVVLLPLFYAYSGARTDLGLVRSADDWWTVCLVLTVACAAKLGGSAAAARLTGLSWRESGALGVLMNTRGLKELIVLNIGLDLGVLSPSLFAVLVIMGVATTVMTSPLLRLLYPQRPVGDASEQTSEATDPFRVLVCVATGRSGPGLVSLAGALGGGRSGDPVHAVHLLHPTDRVSFALETSSGAEPGLQALLDRAAALSLAVRPLSFVSTEASVDICRVAEAKRSDLVLMGWHRPVVNATLLGGTVYEVMKAATGARVGVLVDRGLREPRRLIVPYAGSLHDHAALALSHRVAVNVGAEVTVLHAHGAEAGARRAVWDVFGGSAQSLVEVEAIEGVSAVEGVLGLCRRGLHDLLIVGVGNTWGLEQRLLGLQPERLMQECPISVLVVRGTQNDVVARGLALGTTRTVA